MFENLSQRLGKVFDRLRGRGALSEGDVDEALREVRLALLEADVALSVVKTFIAGVRLRAIGQEVIKSVTPGQMVVKIVHDHLVETLGSTASEINLRAVPPVPILMVGLQGSGKTTTTAKIARRLSGGGLGKDRKRVLMASLDVARPAAQEQLAQWAGTGMKPDQIIAMKGELKASKELSSVLADEKSILQRNVAALKNKLSKYEDENRVVAMPGLKGAVVAVDPKWEFVVINVGSQQGALEGGLLMVRRGDKLVGKVKIVTVEANRSVANVLPAWKQGDVAVAAGDQVLY